MRLPVVVLISGRGTNLQAIIDQSSSDFPAEIRAVISSNPQAQGLERARRAGLTTEVVDHRKYALREDFDRALLDVIDSYRPQLGVMAGFMRIVGAGLIRHYSGRLINIHPSLLPQFKGLDTHARALRNGARQHGASVHFVTPEVDGGPVIIQAALLVQPQDTVQTLASGVLALEHRILPQAIKWFAEGRLTIKNGQVLLDGRRCADQGLASGEDQTAEPSCNGASP